MRCANPACQAEALYLRSGSIYCIDREVAMHDEQGKGPPARKQRQMIWLCRECSQRCIVETWRQPGQQLRWQDPLKRPMRRHLVRPEELPAAA